MPFYDEVTPDSEVKLPRGITEIKKDKGDRSYVKIFGPDGSVLYHGLAFVCRVEILGPKETRAKGPRGS